MRAVSEELDNILDKEFKILDHGFIRVIDYMGNDSSIAEMARCSYSKGTKTVSDDEGLIRHLMRNDHTSPFEACELKFHIKMPIMVARQFMRHRTFSINENSLRFSEATEDKLLTKENEWRIQSKSDKQGSEGYIDSEIGKSLTDQEILLIEHIDDVYKDRLSKGVSRELARKELPLSNYTEAYMKIDLHNLLHFLRLRMDHHAQYESRLYAECIGDEIVSKWVPITWKAFLDYKMYSITFSREEINILKSVIDLESFDYLENPYIIDSSNLSKREKSEFIEKIKKNIG